MSCRAGECTSLIGQLYWLSLAHRHSVCTLRVCQSACLFVHRSLWSSVNPGYVIHTKGSVISTAKADFKWDKAEVLLPGLREEQGPPCLWYMPQKL